MKGLVEDIVDTKQSKPIINSMKLEKKRRKKSRKRIGRPPQKLRITIAANQIESVTLVNTNTNGANNESDDCNRYNKGRPPKKRLSTITTVAPSMEDIRRESMKFRKMMMANFDQPKVVNDDTDSVPDQIQFVTTNNPNECEVVTTTSNKLATNTNTDIVTTATVKKKKKKKKSSRYDRDTDKVVIFLQIAKLLTI